MRSLVGTYYILAISPVWFTALVLWFLTIGILHPIRQKFEGLSYNISYASELGAMLLIGIILVLNVTAIAVRSRLRLRFSAGHF